MSVNSGKNSSKNSNIKIYAQIYAYVKMPNDKIIPLKIFQTWYTKDLSPKMKERVENIKASNPEFEHHLFDDNDCREFIKNNFDSHVLHAFDSLVPGAYKADLWRYCVLFKHGGIYLDIKLNCINGFKLIELTRSNHFVKDRILPLSIYNALMVCKPRTPLLWYAIRNIVLNVKTNFFGKSALDPTGPVLLGNIILKNKIRPNIDMIHHKDGGYIIYKKKFIISTEYPQYNTERVHIKRYDRWWDERKIYK